MKHCLIIALWFLSVALFGQERRAIKPPAFSIKLVPETTNKFQAADTLSIREEHNFIHLGLKDGLSCRYVRKVWLDSRNYLWIATAGGGVSIYDGKRFHYLNTSNGLSNDIVHDFEEGNDGRVWIATNAGVSIFDGKHWEYLTMENGDFGARVVWSLLKDKKGRMFIGTAGKGFSIYDQGKTTHYLEINDDTTVQVYDMMEDPSNGKVWMGTHANGVLEYSDGVVKQHFLGADKYAPENVVMGVEVMKVGKKSVIYAGSRNGLFQYNEGEWNRFGIEDGLPHNFVLELASDRRGDLWVGTLNGLVKWNQNDLKKFQKEEGLNGPKVQSICEDAWGNLWIGYRDNSVSKYQGEKFIHYSKEGGFPDNIDCMFRDSKGNIWFGMKSSGVVRYDGKHFLHYGPDQGFPSNLVVSAVEEDDDGNMWFGLEGELVVKFDGEYFYHYSGRHNRKNADFNRIVHTLNYSQGQLWVGTRHSPVRITKDSVHYYGHQQNIVDHYWFLDAYKETDGTFWFGTYGGGAAKVNFEKNQTTLLTTEVGLSTNAVSNIARDHHGNYWFNGDGEKVQILKAGSLDKESDSWEWMELGREEGLPTNDLGRTFVQSDGDIWISSSRGMCKVVLNGKDIFENDYRIKVYAFNEGFRGIESNEEALEAPDGRLWFYSNGSISVLNPRLDVHSKLPPSPIITKAKIQLKEVDWEAEKGAEYSSIDNWTGLPQDLSLPYGSNHLSFEFIGISHANPDGVQFSWRLVGFDDDFCPWVKTTTATYANLPWGDYQFELRCQDEFGNVSEPLIYRVQIRKAYYHTWLFRIVVLLVLILLIYFIFRWRTAALKRRQKVLEQTVDERTLEIKKAKEEIEHQQEEILDSIAYAKRIQEAILPPNESVKKIVPNSFVLYQPKDIVAGDFYWVEKVEDDIFIAAADCTGHGVPGAMVSVVCSNALNHAVLNEGVRDPGKILDRVTELVVEQFKKGNEKVKDGMDIALCRLNGAELQYAGAHNPLWKVAKDSEELEEVKATKQPVGQFDGKVPFKTERISFAKGDRIYLFSDGFADQFGGPKGKKLKTANFKKLILSLQDVGIHEQGHRLLQSFEEWKGKLEQLDDVCVIGFEM